MLRRYFRDDASSLAMARHNGVTLILKEYYNYLFSKKMSEKNETRNTVKVIYPKYYKYWIGPAHSGFTNKSKGHVGLDNV